MKTAHAYLEHRKGRWHWIVQKCPHCGRRHVCPGDDTNQHPGETLKELWRCGHTNGRYGLAAMKDPDAATFYEAVSLHWALRYDRIDAVDWACDVIRRLPRGPRPKRLALACLRAGNPEIVEAAAAWLARAGGAA